MEQEIVFVAATEEMARAEKALALTRGTNANVLPCPFSVGDFISYPAQPALAFRVAYRIYRYGTKDKLPVWLIGLEKADHPLAIQAGGERSSG